VDSEDVGSIADAPLICGGMSLCILLGLPNADRRSGSRGFSCFTIGGLAIVLRAIMVNGSRSLALLIVSRLLVTCGGNGITVAFPVHATLQPGVSNALSVDVLDRLLSRFCLYFMARRPNILTMVS